MVITAKVDERRRVLIPQAKPGQVLAIQDNGDGSVTLVPVKAEGEERGEPSVLDSLTPMTDAEAQAAFGPNEEFDALEHHLATLPAGPPPEQE